MTVKIKERAKTKALVYFRDIKPGQFFVYSSEHSVRNLQLRTHAGAVIVATGEYDDENLYSKDAVFEIIHDVDILWG
uniref:Uncharacterized protein n=1 Tax=Klebsiella phage vB-Kvc-Y10 TaxID=3236922 RepID=A0AB39CBV4_9CAUD